MSTFITQRVAPGPVWAHFLILGLLFHIGLTEIFPAPKPSLGPPSAARLQLLRDTFLQTSGALPEEQQLDDLVDIELRNELLFREALKAELHLKDSAIEQRLIRNSRFLYPELEMSEV